MALEPEDITRGIGTYSLTESPALGLLDSAFGGSDDPNVDTDTTLTAAGLNSSIGEQVTNSSQENTALTSVDTGSNVNTSSNALTGQSGVTGSTALTDSTTANTGLQNQTGTQGVGAFTGQTGLGMSGYDPITGQFNSQLAQPYAQNVNQALGASGQAYGALGAQDFNGTMGQRYNALEALQEQDRLQAQMNMEDRLYGQGRLGSTGGALQQNALLDAIAQQQAVNANTAFGQAMAQRQQFGDQAMQFGQAALQPQAMSIQQLQAMGALAPQVSQNQVSTNNLSQLTGLQDTTGFTDQSGYTNTLGNQNSTGYQDSTSSSTANASSQTLSEQLAYEELLKQEKVRAV